MKEYEYIDRYVLSKKAHIEMVKDKTSEFMERQLGFCGRDDYERVRNENIKEQHSFSTVIPWILGDLCGVTSEKCVDIASSWEAIVLYVRQLDSLQDKSELTDTDKNLMLSASILFAHGLDQLKELLGPNSSSSLIPLYSAARYQKIDMYLAKNNKNNTEDEHLEIMRGKNIFAKIISQFYAENSDTDNEDISDFIDCLATFAQIIDDIKDLEDDIDNSSYSHLICSLSKEGLEAKNTFSAIKSLIETGILKRSVKLAIKYLDRSIKISERVRETKRIDVAENGEMQSYLKRQRDDVEALLHMIISIEGLGSIPDSCYQEILKKKNSLWMGS